MTGILLVVNKRAILAVIFEYNTSHRIFSFESWLTSKTVDAPFLPQKPFCFCGFVYVSILSISSLQRKTSAWIFLVFIWESQFDRKRLNKSASDNMRPLLQLFCSNGLAAFICWLKLKQLRTSKLITEQNIIGFMKFGSYHLEMGGR